MRFVAMRRGRPLARMIRTLALLMLSLGGSGSSEAAFAPAALLKFQRQWRFAPAGIGIGAAGIAVADLDRNGSVEIVLSARWGGSFYWYTLNKTPGLPTYSMTWVSDPSTADITALSVLDLQGTGKLVVCLGFSDGKLRIYDGRSKKEVGTISTAGGSVRRILFADADNDGAPELLFCTDTTTYFCNPSTYAVYRQIPYGASDLKAGNVDGDPAIELVYASGKVLEVSPGSLVEQWTYSGGAFGARLELADIDGDGMLEIIAAASWYTIACFDADVQTQKWSYSASLDIGAFILADVDGGLPEIIYGDGQWGAIHCLDAVTRSEKWQIPNPEHGVTGIAVADTDADGELEIMWGAGYTSSGQDIFFIHGVASKALEWKSEDVDGPFNAMDIGDVDGDGKDEIVFCSFESESGYNDGTLFILDAATKQVKWESPHNLFLGSAWTGVHAVRIGDVDGDGKNEIVVGTDDLYDGKIYIIDGVTHAIKNAYKYDSGAPIFSLELADVDHDGKMDIIAGGSGATSGAPGVFVYVIDGATGAVKWKSGTLGSSYSSVAAVRVADVDGDGKRDIVAIDGSVTVIDGTTHAQWQSAATNYTALDLADVDGDGLPDLVLGTSSGLVTAIRGDTHAVIASFSTGSTSIDAVRVGDVDGDGTPEVVVAAGGILRIYAWNGATRVQANVVAGATAGSFGSLRLWNANGGPNLEILVGTNYGVTQYGVSSNGDSDNDGLADDWEELHFGAGNLEAKPGDDPDSDGSTNLQEFLGGTDPLDAASVPVATPPPPSSSHGGGGCGALGLEALALAGLLGLLRRLRRGSPR